MNQDDHALLELEKKFEATDNKKYKVEAIINSVFKYMEKKQITKCQASTTLFQRKII